MVGIRGLFGSLLVECFVGLGIKLRLFHNSSLMFHILRSPIAFISDFLQQAVLILGSDYCVTST
jgi:hypothetical protein